MGNTLLKIGIISFPGNNCEVESVRAVKRCGMEPVAFRWNDDRSKLNDVDAFFLPGGFSYEDRGRAGLIAARDPIFEYIGQRAHEGTAVIGNCNGAQMLIESGLVPIGTHLDMCLARNSRDGQSVGFLNQWLYIRPTCARARCVTSDWGGVIQIPIAHGEGRFVTRDSDLIKHLQDNDQIAFSYCDADGVVSDSKDVTPNGSILSIAGICNPAGNVVALMPHPERTPDGDPYFFSLKKWVEEKALTDTSDFIVQSSSVHGSAEERPQSHTEIFIDTKIVNNEERTVEKALQSVAPTLKLTQLRYYSLPDGDYTSLLSRIAYFNPNKEIAYVRDQGRFHKWNADAKQLDAIEFSPLDNAHTFLRRDDPDAQGADIGRGAETGVCYACSDCDKEILMSNDTLKIFANPHASTLELVEN